MLKIKASKKDMKENYKILGTGYCSMHYLLKFKKPVAYSTRCEGWACDYYDVDDVIISTGYAPLKSKNIDLDYDTIRAYENKARDIINSNKSWEDKEKQVNQLLKQLLSDPYKRLRANILMLLTNEKVSNAFSTTLNIMDMLNNKGINREKHIINNFLKCELVNDNKILKIYDTEDNFIKIRLKDCELI